MTHLWVVKAYAPPPQACTNFHNNDDALHASEHEKALHASKCIYPHVMPAHGWVEKEQEDKMLESVTSELTPKCDFQHATDQRGAMMKR